MCEMFNFKEPTNLQDYTLILPCVSVGNVPQLTVDLFVKSCNFKKTATVWHPGIIATVGSDPYTARSGEVCTACELYTNEILKLATVQLRSSIEFKLTMKFIRDLKDTIQQFGLKSIYILSSGFDYELHNIQTERFFYLSNELTNEIMDRNSVKQLEQDENRKYSVNGGGISVKLYEVLSEVFNVTLLGKFVSEGDNRPDACAMWKKLFSILGKDADLLSVSYPSSWEYVFGSPAPIEIF